MKGWSVRLHRERRGPSGRWGVEQISAALTAGTLVGIIAFAAFLSADSTVLLPREQGDGDPLRRYILPVVPQSWPFFTKLPNDPEYAAYAVDGQGVHSRTDFPNAQASNLFGFARTQRAQGPEMANLSNMLEQSEWVNCLAVEGDCVQSASKTHAVELVNSSTFPTLCGTFVLAATEPVPWSFRDDYTGWRQDSYAVNVRVSCAR